MTIAACDRPGLFAILRSLTGALCLLALLSGPATADVSQRPMRFEHLGIEEGLSQSNVFAILQDSKGQMWIGTEDGLNSYDGYEFVRYARERGNPAALASDFIYDIAEDDAGNLWIGTNGGGLARFDRATGQFTSWRHDAETSNSIASDIVRTIHVAADGILWLGTRGAGLERFDSQSNQFTHYSLGEGAWPTASPNDVFAIHTAADGSLWLGTNRGLSRLDPESGDLVTYGPVEDDAASLSDHRVRAILADGEHHLWVGTYDGGLNRLDLRTGRFEQFRHDPANPASLASDRVTSIFRDSDGRLWIGTSGGLNLYDAASGGFARYLNVDTDPHSLGDDSITALFQDRGGIVWVGTRNRGLSKWNPQTWLYGLDRAEQLTADAEATPNVTSFVEDAGGVLWVGTFGDGLGAIDRASGEVRRYLHDPADPGSLSDNRVMSLLIDRRGTIWAGTMTGGVNKLDPATGSIEILRHSADDPNSLSADGVMALYEDRQGQVWVGTFGGGANRIDPATGDVTRFLADSGSAAALSSSRVTSFAEDADGRMWIGTDAGGLNVFDPATGRFRNFQHDAGDPKSLSANTIYDLNIDADGTVWIGTQGGGLDRVVGDINNDGAIEFHNTSRADGLSNNVVYGIEFDDEGRLWLSTNFGISRLDPETGEFNNLHRNDGLQSEEFNFGAHYRSASGELFFGGHNGYNAFDPAGIDVETAAPLVMLSGIYGSNELIRADRPQDGEGIELSWRDDRITFEFAAMDFAAPAENRFRYKLEGYDKEWLELGNRRRVTYTDLNDGNYVLRVAAANSFGTWNEAGLSIPVSVSPAPWDTWWAYLCYLAMAALTGFLLWLGHHRKLRREEEYSQRLKIEVDKRTEQLLDRNRQLNQLNQSLQETSLSDPLTGLRNRRFVFEEVSRDLDVIKRKLRREASGANPRETAELVFMMIDLDNFKPINDTYGHAAGDRMLLQLRDVLLGTCRKSDFVIRWGGDEFVVIAKQADPGESEQLAERIRTKIANHEFNLGDGNTARTTCSIGFAAYPLFRAQADEASLDQILCLADDLMYEAKRTRNAWAGMLSPTRAAASENLDLSSLDPTSLLFRARRSDGIKTFIDESDADTADDWQAYAEGGAS